MLLTVLEAPVAFMYTLTGSKKLGKLVRRMNRKRKQLLDEFLDEHPDLEVENYQQAERKKVAEFWIVFVVGILLFIVIPSLAGYVELH